jgi:hypothetical protein
MSIKKIFIENKERGEVEFPDTKEAGGIFWRTKQAYANHETMSLKLVFTDAKLARLKTYQKGGAESELQNLEFYIQLGAILKFDIQDAQQLRSEILLINDSAHVNFNIKKRLKLINKKNKTETKESYLFWDIENFSSISSVFNHVIEPYDIANQNIFLAANPDSLYLKKAEWEANLFDYGKSLNSFNFMKCEHGKNVADDILLQNFKNANLKNVNVFILTFDRELKERFQDATHKSNNLFVMTK